MINTGASKAKKQLSEKLAKEMAKFLKSGGKIESVPMGKSAESVTGKKGTLKLTESIHIQTEEAAAKKAAKQL